jgi:uncharacterized protein YbaR (Trm112 family)
METIRMKPGLREILRCPTCRGLLADGAEELRCSTCRREYPIVDGIPVFIPPGELKTVEQLPARTGYDCWLHYFTLTGLSRTARCLDIGAGDMGLDHPNIVRLDVFRSPHTDIVADAHCLPFADNVFDFVFTLAVLEHLRQPFAAAAEMHRILERGGYVYCDTNFVFAYHAFPHHYFNYSIHGIEQVFGQFEKLRVCVPPYQMPSYAIESLFGTYLAYFTPVTRTERKAMDAARALLRRPWRDFDRHFPPEWAYTCAAGVCFYGMKGPESRALPEPARRAWAAREDLQRMFPVPHDLSTDPNLMSWLATSGRGQHPEMDEWLRAHPLIPADSLNLGTPWSEAIPLPWPPGVPPAGRSAWRRALERARRALRRSA